MEGDEIPLYEQTEGEYEGEEEEELDEEELEAQNTIPLFKYQSLPFCQKDEKETLRVTCFRAHERLVALGTQDGQVRVLDILGNLIKKFHPHRSTINDIYIDPEAELIATCSDDGKVSIQSVFEDQPEAVHELGYPVTSLFFDPLYRTSKVFFCGTRNGFVYVSKKGFMGFGTKIKQIGTETSPIDQISGNATMVAWSTSSHVRIFDATNSAFIGIIKIDEPLQYKCFIHWSSPTQIVVGCNDHLVIANLFKTKPMIRLQENIRLPYVITGLSYLDGSYVLLYFDTEADLQSDEPHLAISYKGAVDFMGIKYQNNSSHRDYSLVGLPHDHKYYVVSPSEIVLAETLSTLEKINFYSHQKQYEKAFEIASAHMNDVDDSLFLRVVEEYLEFLIERSSFENAAIICTKLLGEEAILWEKWVLRFSTCNQLDVIAPYVPLNKPQLNCLVYDMILADYTKNNPYLLLKCIEEWPTSHYSIQNVLMSIADLLTTNTINSDVSVLYRQALGLLYSYDKQYERSANEFLKLKAWRSLFQLIESQSLSKFASEHLLELFEGDPVRSMQLFVALSDKIKPQLVLLEISDREETQLSFLRNLFGAKDWQQIDEDIHNHFLFLLAKHNASSELLEFLGKSTKFDHATANSLFDQFSQPDAKELLLTLSNIHTTDDAS